MREIKFRAWSKNQEFMFPWKDVYLGGSEATFKEAFDSANKSGFILMQYTGLKDKNGKEIYEGDIIRIMYHYDSYGAKEHEELRNYEVIWWEESGSWQMDKSGRVFKDAKEGKVIGNIYENPELLK